tara:strand:- start:1219 stop:1479 length:261 start_codon:yes stop_codon:yes gene_type:complete
MNPLEILEKFGFPAAIAMAMGYFIWRSQSYIQEDLSKDIASKFERLEGIIIALINQQKKMQIELRGIKAKYEALVDIILKLMKGDK